MAVLASATSILELAFAANFVAAALTRYRASLCVVADAIYAKTTVLHPVSRWNSTSREQFAEYLGATLPRLIIARRLGILLFTIGAIVALAAAGALLLAAEYPDFEVPTSVLTTFLLFALFFLPGMHLAYGRILNWLVASAIRASDEDFSGFMARSFEVHRKMECAHRCLCETLVRMKIREWNTRWGRTPRCLRRFC